MHSLKRFLSFVDKRNKSSPRSTNSTLPSPFTESKMSFNDLFESSRLVYRTLEKDDAGAKYFFTKAIHNDPHAYAQGMELLTQPPTSKTISNIIN
jgi:hypothetical protein